MLGSTHIAPSLFGDPVGCRDEWRPGRTRNHQNGTWPSQHELPCGAAVAMATKRGYELN